MAGRAARAVIVCATCLLALGQAPPSFRSGVDVVQIDVSVLDGRRQPVRGLTAKDFTVLEDGKPREIVAFTPVDLPARTRTSLPAAGAASWVRDVTPDVATNDVAPEGRLVVIVFDWSIRFDDSRLARNVARATVNGLGPGDQAAVVFTSEFSNAGVPQNFTADRPTLLRAIDQPMAFAMKGMDSIRPQAGGFINANGQLIADPYGYASGGCRCRACTLDAMTRVADALRSVPGRRKVMIFIGEVFRGFEAAMVPPRVAMRGLPPPPFTGTTMYVPDANGPGTCSQPLKEARERLTRAAGLANLTIHVVDPVGLETLDNSPLGGASPDTIQERHANLHQPADMTGGRTVLNTNTPENAVPAILDESQSYYLLGFAASDATSARTHRVDVTVDRREVLVRSRRGYVGNDEALARSAAAPGAPLTAAISGVLPAADIPLALVAAPFATPGKATGTVALTIGVGSREPAAGARAAGPGPAGGTLHVLMAALAPTARVIASREETVAFGGGAAGGYDLLSRLELAPGRYEIRVASDMPSGRRGGVFAFVDVPDFAHDDLTLSGVALGTTPASPTAPADRLADLMPILPTARRTFARTDAVRAFVRVQQGGRRAEPVTMESRIVDEAGRVVHEDARTLAGEQFGPGRGVDYLFEPRLADLAPGAYLLSIEATSGGRSQRRNVRFAVR